jgi:hypothetical protein
LPIEPKKPPIEIAKMSDDF